MRIETIRSWLNDDGAELVRLHLRTKQLEIVPANCDVAKAAQLAAAIEQALAEIRKAFDVEREN